MIIDAFSFTELLLNIKCSSTVNLSTEADKTCSPDLIVLDPQVVVEYGGTVVLNCTSTSQDELDVFWKIGTEDKLSCIEVPVTKWDMKAVCIIQLNDSFQCSNEVDIIVYSKCHFKS